MKALGLSLSILYATVCFSQTTVLPFYTTFVEGIIENNPMALRAKNEKRYADLQLKAAQGSYDPILAGNYDHKQFNGSNYFTTLSTEIKQPIFTNQYLKAGYDYGMGPNVNPEFYTPSQGLPYLGLEIGVLQGLVIDKRRAEVLKSRAYVNYYTAEQQIQLNALLYEASLRYFEWLFSAKQIALNNYFMNAALTRLQGIQSLAQIGERATVDTVEAAILYQTRLLDLQNAIMDNQKSTNDLSFFIWKDNLPLSTATNFLVVDSLETYYEKAKNALVSHLNPGNLLNPLLTKYTAYQKVLDTDVRLKKELIKPTLNLKYNLLSNSASPVNPIFSSNSYKWGVNMSFPLFLRNPDNAYKMAKVIAENNSLELQNKTNELSFKLNALKQTIAIQAQQLLNAERSVNYCKLLLDAEKLKFTNGESSVFMINTRENKVLENELKLAEYELKFIKSVLQVIYLNGNLAYKF